VSGGKQYVSILGITTGGNAAGTFPTGTFPNRDILMTFALCPNGTAPAATSPYYLASFQPWTNCGIKG